MWKFLKKTASKYRDRSRSKQIAIELFEETKLRKAHRRYTRAREIPEGYLVNVAYGFAEQAWYLVSFDHSEVSELQEIKSATRD
ncbi:hypothetical protein [Lacipirellula parvula]|uniref:Uncharacterized protein n=1 Tax=Lacipirellula parvula TaxID=2650471 RepID=A0A5K7XI00_9BACT|nr:hypothetical protein [Lacipirellula parvula]BBO36025.1 hypothetical protein PLANPX_5637 [Lacipirellula parvula]